MLAKRLVPIKPTGYWNVKAVSHVTLRDSESGAVLPYDRMSEGEMFRRIVERLANTDACRHALSSDNWRNLYKIRSNAARQKREVDLPSECRDGNTLVKQMLPTALLETLGSSDYATVSVWWTDPPAAR